MQQSLPIQISIIERIFEDRILTPCHQGFPILTNLSAIKKCFCEGHYLDPSLLNILRASGKANGVSDLTKREFEIFIQSSTGKPDDRIAADLCVELAYIKNTKSKIAKKISDANLDNLLQKLMENLNPVIMQGNEID